MEKNKSSQKKKTYTEKEMLEKCLSFGEHIQKELGYNYSLIGELKIWNENRKS